MTHIDSPTQCFSIGGEANNWSSAGRQREHEREKNLRVRQMDEKQVEGIRAYGKLCLL